MRRSTYDQETYKRQLGAAATGQLGHTSRHRVIFAMEPTGCIGIRWERCTAATVQAINVADPEGRWHEALYKSREHSQRKTAHTWPHPGNVEEG